LVPPQFAFWLMRSDSWTPIDSLRLRKSETPMESIGLVKSQRVVKPVRHDFEDFPRFANRPCITRGDPEVQRADLPQPRPIMCCGAEACSPGAAYLSTLSFKPSKIRISLVLQWTKKSGGVFRVTCRPVAV